MAIRRERWVMMRAIVISASSLALDCPPPTINDQFFTVALYPAGQGPGTTGNPFPTRVYWLVVKSEPQGLEGSCYHHRFDFVDDRRADVWTLNAGAYSGSQTDNQGSSTSLEFYGDAAMSPTASCNTVLIGQFRGEPSGTVDLIPGTLVRQVVLGSPSHTTRGTEYIVSGSWTASGGGSGSYYVYVGRVPVNPPSALVAGHPLEP